MKMNDFTMQRRVRKIEWLRLMVICFGTIVGVSSFVTFAQTPSVPLVEDCLPEETKSGQAFKPGCFGWSETHANAVCVVGSESSDRSPSLTSSADWHLVSLPQGLVSEECNTSMQENQDAPGALVLNGKRLTLVQTTLDKKGIMPLPEPSATFTPRTTLDLSASGRKIRLIWNQKLLETRDVGCGLIPIYRDRISMMCSPLKKADLVQKASSAQQTDLISTETASVQSFPNAKAPALPKLPKMLQDTVYLDEQAGEATANIYSLSKGKYVLVELKKSHGEPGLHRNNYTAALIDTQRCLVIRGE